MTPLLFALSLLAAPPAPGTSTWGGVITAGRLYDACVRYVADVSRPSLDDGEEACAVAAAAMLAANEAGEGADAADRSVCLPEVVTRAEGRTGSPLAEAFIAYVDRNPASRALDVNDVLPRALAEKWPCPH